MNPIDYSVLGQTPKSVAAPATTAQAQEMVRKYRGRTIIPWGGGTQQHVGYPPRDYDLALSTQNLDQVVEYVPPDMTVTAQSGMTVAHLQETLAQNGQWLPVDVAFPERQTLGGIIATRAHSVCRFGCGSVRDSLIGVRIINHLGEEVTGGGKVVKNVAGYDLPKLYCGSWGTLGLLTQASFKVAPLPEARATAVIALPSERSTEEALNHLFSSPLEPAFIYLLDPAAAHTLVSDAQQAQYLIVGMDGPAEAVAWQLETLGAPALPSQEAATLRAGLRDFPLRDAPMSAEFHILSSQIGAFARMVEWTARRYQFNAHSAGDAATGILHVHFYPELDQPDWAGFLADLMDKATRVGGSCVLTRMPQPVRALDCPVWFPLLADFQLMSRLKLALDPDAMWNPGRFVGQL